MPSNLTFTNPAEFAQSIPDTPLSAAEIQVQLGQATVDKTLTFGLQGLTFAIDAGTTASLQAFNSADDVDEDGVIGQKLAPGTGDEFALPPPLSVGDRSFLKYQLKARAKATMAGAASFLSSSGELEKTVVLADYHAHAHTESARQAAVADSGKLRVALLVEDLSKLNAQEALAYRATGRLRASVDVKWSDLLTGNLNALTKLVAPDELVAVSTNLGATASATVSVNDEFIVVFSRAEPGKLRVSVRKAAAMGFSASASVSAEVALDSNAPVNAVLAAWLGKPLEWFEGLLNKAAQHPLSTDEQNALRWALDRMGHSGVEADAGLLKTTWEKQKAKAMEAVKELATQRIAAGFSYEYERTDQRATLFEAVLTDAEASAHHWSFLTGELDKVLGWMRSQGRAPDTYLRQRTLERRRAWGFSLGIGSWTVGSREEDRLRFISTRRTDGQLRLANLGARRYEGNLFGAKVEWTADFRAEMPGYAAAPSANDFTYGLHLLLRREEASMTEETMRRAVDDAIAWRVFDDADEEKVLEKIGTSYQKERVETRVELKLLDPAFRSLGAKAISSSTSTLARALARALPWYPWKARQLVEIRESAYAPLWEAFLRDGGWSPATAARTAAHTLRHHPIAKEIYDLEGVWPSTGLVTFADVIHAHPSVATSAERFRAGLVSLAEAIQGARPAKVIEDAFLAMQAMWTQSFFLKASGAYLLALAAQTPEGVGTVERTFTVGLPDSNAQVVFSTSRKPGGT